MLVAGRQDGRTAGRSVYREHVEARFARRKERVARMERAGGTWPASGLAACDTTEDRQNPLPCCAALAGKPHCVQPTTGGRCPLLAPPNSPTRIPRASSLAPRTHVSCQAFSALNASVPALSLPPPTHFRENAIRRHACRGRAREGAIALLAIHSAMQPD